MGALSRLQKSHASFSWQSDKSQYHITYSSCPLTYDQKYLYIEKIMTRLQVSVVVVQTPSCVWLYNPKDCSTSGLPVPHHLPGFSQVLVYYIGDAVQASHPPMPSSPSALNLSQHQGLFQWVVCSQQMTKILELQHQSFQWIFRANLP